MTGRPLTVMMKQGRGSWFAKPSNASAREITEEPVPVLRLWPEGRSEFDAPRGMYRADAYSLATDEPAQWWNTPRRADWKAALTEGGVAAIRKGVMDGSRNGTVVAKWIGLYRIIDATFDEVEMTVSLDPKRLAEIS